MHKADEPDAVLDFFDADGLTRQRFAQIDFLAIKADAAAAGDQQGFIVKRVVRLGNAHIRSGGSGVELCRALHVERFGGVRC